MLYQIVVFLHVVSVLGYLLAHGVSATVTFALKKERDIARVCALLDLSRMSATRLPRNRRSPLATPARAVVTSDFKSKEKLK